MKNARTLIPALLLAAAAQAAAAQASADSVGVRHVNYHAPERDREVSATLWYPAEPGGSATSVGENIVFTGTPAFADAPPLPGRHPLVVVSHGAGGSGTQFAWLADALVQHGFAVLAPNHPGSTTGDASAQGVVKLWLRPADVSAALDAAASSEGWGDLVDESRVGVFGFSAGGYTAMALAGARIDTDKLRRFCDGDRRDGPDCAFLRRGGVDLHQFDLTPAGRDNRDPRIRAFFVADPGVATTLSKSSLASIDAPMTALNLGPVARVPGVLDAREIVATVPGARLLRVEDAHHVSLLPACKPAGPAILAEEGEPEELCADVAGGRERAAIQREVAEMVVEAMLAGLPRP